MGATTLGPYTKYEIPDSLLVTFYQIDGVTPIDLSGYSVEVHWWIKSQSPADTVQTFSGSLSDATNGIVAVPWSSATEVFEEVGLHEVEIWVGDGVNRYGSEIFRFQVRESVATSTPTV